MRRWAGVGGGLTLKDGAFPRPIQRATDLRPGRSEASAYSYGLDYRVSVQGARRWLRRRVRARAGGRAIRCV